MNIEAKSQIDVSNIKNNTQKKDNSKKVDEKSSFAEELSSLSETKEKETNEKVEKTEEKKDDKPVNDVDGDGEILKTESQSADVTTKNVVDDFKENSLKTQSKDLLKEDKKYSKKSDKKSDETIDNVLNGLKGTVEEIQKLNEKKPINQKDDNLGSEIKDDIFDTDNKGNHLNNKEDNNLINNDMNIQDKNDPTLTPQMNMNMNFNSDGKPFNDFLNAQNNNEQLVSTQQELAEESAILSTMSENIAIANKNNALARENLSKKMEKTQINYENNIIDDSKDNNPFDSKVKTVSNSDGIKKVDKKSNITVETVVKYDNLIMDEADVDFFAKLVENGSADMAKDVQQSQKSSQVSKTLADMLAKSMKDNQPVRIDFDNNISVIIKVSREGKISADFLPSSQVAEAYLKENLPLLKQRFDDNNIEYDELNQRKQRQDDNKDRKKGSKDE